MMDLNGFVNNFNKRQPPLLYSYSEMKITEEKLTATDVIGQPNQIKLHSAKEEIYGTPCIADVSDMTPESNTNEATGQGQSMKTTKINEQQCKQFTKEQTVLIANEKEYQTDRTEDDRILQLTCSSPALYLKQ